MGRNNGDTEREGRGLNRNIPGRGGGPFTSSSPVVPGPEKRSTQSYNESFHKLFGVLNKSSRLKVLCYILLRMTVFTDSH